MDFLAPLMSLVDLPGAGAGSRDHRARQQEARMFGLIDTDPITNHGNAAMTTMPVVLDQAGRENGKSGW
jgi:hypothetical protein